MSGVPVWAQEGGPSSFRGRKAVTGGRDEDSSKSLGRSGSSKRNRGSDRPEDQRRPKLGRTSGVFAAGAWAARLEIAHLLESGISTEALLSEINSGRESDRPLEMRGGKEAPFGGDSPGEVPFDAHDPVQKPIQRNGRRNKEGPRKVGTPQERRESPIWLTVDPLPAEI